jgi:hypothetical protein
VVAPDQTEKAPPAADVVSTPPAMTYDEQIEAIRKHPTMLPGDRQRALQLVRNAKAVAQDNAALKGRLLH